MPFSYILPFPWFIFWSRSKDKSGEWQDVTEWHRIVLFNKNAEIAEKYLKKGGAVYIEGRIQTRSWEDQQSGQKRYTTEIIADQLKMMGGRDSYLFHPSFLVGQQ